MQHIEQRFERIHAKHIAHSDATRLVAARRKMPPRKKTGVQNVDIGGAYKLERVGPLDSSKMLTAVSYSLALWSREAAAVAASHIALLNAMSQLPSNTASRW